MVCRIVPAPRGVSRGSGRRRDTNSGSVLRSHQNRKGAEVGFTGETRRSNLRGISAPKKERIRRTWIPATSLVTACSTCLAQQACCRDLLKLRLLCPAEIRPLRNLSRPGRNLISGRNKRTHSFRDLRLAAVSTAQAGNSPGTPQCHNIQLRRRPGGCIHGSKV